MQWTQWTESQRRRKDSDRFDLSINANKANLAINEISEDIPRIIVHIS